MRQVCARVRTGEGARINNIPNLQQIAPRWGIAYCPFLCEAGSDAYADDSGDPVPHFDCGEVRRVAAIETSRMEVAVETERAAVPRRAKPTDE